jgi:norsolorinic acid ketoreductase
MQTIAAASALAFTFVRSLSFKKLSSPSHFHHQGTQRERKPQLHPNNMAPTIVLITGANRGIGQGLTERFLAEANHTVIAAVRNPGHPTVQKLQELPKGPDSQLIVVKLDASVEEDAKNAVTELQQKHGIDHLDIVIANAGIGYIYPTVADVKISDIKAHMECNVYGVIALYQATRDLLKKSSREPIFLPMGSSAGMLM